MLEYIYFVKCPGCEDEHFTFFNEAKDFAMSLLSKKPIITQIEVDRNDFGECVDSCDLGTVWSWEDMMNTEEEPTASVFTKDDLVGGVADDDAEFAALDNSVDDIPDVPRKPVPADMSISDLVEAMEANEDTVECTGCEEVFPKDECFYKEGIGWLCDDCEDSIVKCGWCDDLFDKSECRYEVDLGWLCDRCQAGIMSRGEPLTFRENTYWDFLDEAAEPSQELLDMVADHKISHIDFEQEIDRRNRLAQKTGKCPICGGTIVDMVCDYCRNSYRQDGSSGDKHLIDALLLKSIEDLDPTFKELSIDNKVEYIHKAFGNSFGGDSATAKKQIKQDLLLTAKRDKELKDALAKVKPEDYKIGVITEAMDPHDLVELEYPSLTVTLYGDKRDVDDWDEIDHTDSHVFLVPKVEVATAIWENWITEEDAKDVKGGLEALEDDRLWEQFLETHFEELFEKYEKQILAHFEDEATEDFRERSQEEYNLDSWSADTDRAYDAWRDERYFGESFEEVKPFLAKPDELKESSKLLADCPECGVSESFDHTSGICANCGFSI